MALTQFKYIIVDIRSGRQMGMPYESYDEAAAAAKSATVGHPEMFLKIEEV